MGERWCRCRVSSLETEHSGLPTPSYGLRTSCIFLCYNTRRGLVINRKSTSAIKYINHWLEKCGAVREQVTRCVYLMTSNSTPAHKKDSETFVSFCFCFTSSKPMWQLDVIRSACWGIPAEVESRPPVGWAACKQQSPASQSASG
jgi:hypothetical protein